MPEYSAPQNHESSITQKSISDGRLEELRTMPYEEYLNTSEWQAKRVQALENAKYQCQICNSPHPLQVHHRTYARRGNENLSDLTVLCENCHNIFHSHAHLSEIETATSLNAAGPIPIATVAAGYINYVENAFEDVPGSTGIATGFVDLDQLLGGLQPSELYVVAARPGMGKTSFALSLALNAARLGNVHVAIFSLEMNQNQILQRIISMETGIDSQGLKLGNLDDSDRAKMFDSLGRVGALPIFIDDTPGLRIEQLRSHCRYLNHEHHVDLIIVDYLQLMGSNSLRAESRFQEISYISRQLKELARELDIPLLVTVQLPQYVEKREDKHPQLSDLRECGTLETDADAVLFIYCEDAYHENSERKNHADITLAKYRNGPTGTFTLFFQRNVTRFANWQKSNIDLTGF